MREIVILGVLLINLAIQTSLFPFIEIMGVKPDSLLALTVSFALLGGNPTGAVVGFLGGLFQDILSGHNVGLSALQYMVVGYIAGTMYDRVYGDNYFVPLFSTAVAGILKQLIIVAYNFFARTDIPLKWALYRIILPEVVYTLILTPLIFFLIDRLYRNKFMKRKWYSDGYHP
ncbi:MAG: rod shape-determining protein MreD [Clostridiales bacterium]|nr:rod shape-determining protein MreD [Clostridiales bacterium]